MKAKPFRFTKLQDLFSIDPRSLAFFRVTLALLIIFDLIVRATSLRAHYTDFGLLPRGPLLEAFSSPWRISIHYASGMAWFQGLLFLLNGLFASMLLFGYRTPLATFLCWFFMISLHNRNVMVLQAGDLYFHQLLFWSLFLPLGASFSLDRQLAKEDFPLKLSKLFVSMGSAGFFLQVAFVYWFTFLHKITGNAFLVWWKEAAGVYRALHVDQFTTPFGYFVLGFPPLVTFLNYAVILFEGLGPFLLLSPVANSTFRLYGVFGFIAMHMGFNACMVLGPFPWVCSIAVLPFLPSFFWDWVLSRRFFARIVPKFDLAGYFKKLSYKPRHFIAVHPGWLANLFAAVSLVFILWWNIGNVFPKLAMPKHLHGYGMTLYLDQQWAMFSPPLTDDGWYVIPGKLRNGKEVDVFTDGGPVKWEKPRLVAYTYKMERWRKYMMNLWLREHAPYRQYYGRYLCRDWNERHKGDEQLEQFEIIFMREDTLPDYQYSPPQKVLLWKHWCFKVPDEELKRSSK